MPTGTRHDAPSLRSVFPGALSVPRPCWWVHEVCCCCVRAEERKHLKAFPPTAVSASLMRYGTGCGSLLRLGEGGERAGEIHCKQRNIPLCLLIFLSFVFFLKQQQTSLKQDTERTVFCIYCKTGSCNTVQLNVLSRQIHSEPLADTACHNAVLRVQWLF